MIRISHFSLVESTFKISSLVMASPSVMPLSPDADALERERHNLLEALLTERRKIIDSLAQIADETHEHFSKGIFATIYGGLVGQLQSLLEARMYSVNERDENNCTPLHIAAREGRADMVKVLLAFNADPNAVDKDGSTPRDLAMTRRHLAVGRILLCAAKRWQSVDNIDEVMKSLNEMVVFETHTSHFCTIDDSTSVVVCMVGLPGRGKSFISKRICRYFNWKGIPCKVFNAGNYRRQQLGAKETAGAAFYDPSNAEAAALREKMAELAAQDLVHFVETNRVAIGILDATNTTKSRRVKLQRFFGEHLPLARLLFVESVCTDDSIIRENIIRSKCKNDDFRNTNVSEAVKEFEERIHQYKRVYEALDTSEGLPFIKITNVKENVVIHDVRGAIASRMVYFLLNLHAVAFPVFIALPGETTSKAEGRFGDDGSLTEAGEAYALFLKHFIAIRTSDSMPYSVIAGTNNACVATCRVFSGMANLRVLHMRSLDDINYGVFTGLTREEAKQQYPKGYSKVFDEHGRLSFGTAFLKGESFRAVSIRLELALLEIMRNGGPIMAVCSEVPAQALRAFISDCIPEMGPTMEVDQHVIVEIGINGEITVHRMSPTTRSPPCDPLA